MNVRKETCNQGISKTKKRKHNYPDKNIIVQLINDKCTYREMQLILNLSAGTMYRALKFYDLKTKNNNSKTKKNIEKALELRKQAKSFSEFEKLKQLDDFLEILKDLSKRVYNIEGIILKGFIEKGFLEVPANLEKRIRN